MRQTGRKNRVESLCPCSVLREPDDGWHWQDNCSAGPRRPVKGAAGGRSCAHPGYGGCIKTTTPVDLARHSARDVGDEALLLAQQCPTWVGGDRAASARAAVAAGASCLIMDDGFQNPGLHKDLSLLIVDGAVGLGNGHVLPAGPLRRLLLRLWREHLLFC